MSSEIAAPSQLDFEQIKQIIPQRFPFLMLDRVVEIEPGVRAIGLKNLTGNEWFYQGHFPKKAITPGAMLVEAMAQTGIVFFHISSLTPPRDITYLISSLRARFIEPVWPGDQLHIEVTPVKITTNAAILEARITVDNRVVAKAEFGLSAKENSVL